MTFLFMLMAARSSKKKFELLRDSRVTGRTTTSLSLRAFSSESLMESPGPMLVSSNQTFAPSWRISATNARAHSRSEAACEMKICWTLINRVSVLPALCPGLRSLLRLRPLSQLVEVTVNAVEVLQVVGLDVGRNVRPGEKFCRRHAVQNSDDGNLSSPSHPGLRPDVRMSQRPRSQKHYKFVRAV